MKRWIAILAMSVVMTWISLSPAKDEPDFLDFSFSLKVFEGDEYSYVSVGSGVLDKRIVDLPPDDRVYRIIVGRGLENGRDIVAKDGRGPDWYDSWVKKGEKEGEFEIVKMVRYIKIPGEKDGAVQITSITDEKERKEIISRMHEILIQHVLKEAKKLQLRPAADTPADFTVQKAKQWIEGNLIPILNGPGFLSVEPKEKWLVSLGKGVKSGQELGLGLVEIQKKLRSEHSPRHKGISKDTRIKAIERHGCLKCP